MKLPSHYLHLMFLVHCTPTGGDRILFPSFVCLFSYDRDSLLLRVSKRSMQEKSRKGPSVGAGNANPVPVSFETRCITSVLSSVSHEEQSTSFPKPPLAQRLRFWENLVSSISITTVLRDGIAGSGKQNDRFLRERQCCSCPVSWQLWFKHTMFYLNPYVELKSSW